MEINITKFFNESDAFDFASSQFERGENAGQETWNNAIAQASTSPMLSTPEELEAMRDWVLSSGGWNQEEIAAWSDEELNALFIQLISGDMRQIEDLCSNEDGEPDWTKYEEIANEGRISGSLFHADSGEIFYYLGN